LTEVGLPPAAAADVKRRYDELAMDEISLRNLATREGWIDTPEFAAELDEIEADRLAIRDEIGDEAYDHYLFAMGQPNRVYVTDVITNSPAARAGLQTSDVIVRYGEARIFAPNDLVAETQVGSQGEPIRVDITRNGKPLQLEVPRGPLGVEIGVTQEPPEKLR
jgi:S1-C subfamily serine protease